MPRATSHRAARLAAALGAALAAASGCTCKSGSAPDAALPTLPQTALRVGVVPEENIFRQVERYRSITDYVAAKSEVSLQLSVLPRYGGIVDGLVTGSLDAAFLGSFSYVLAHRRAGVEVLARPQLADGRSTYHGVILVHTEDGITSVAQMQGKRFAFVDRMTSAGYLVPLQMFVQAGKDYRSYLKEAYFAGTHEAAILDVLNHKADVGATKSTVFERVRESEPRVDRELTVLSRSPEFPEIALAVRSQLDPELKRRLREALLGMHQDPEGQSRLQQFGAARFVETRDDDYASLVKLVSEAKVDLDTYRDGDGP